MILSEKNLHSYQVSAKDFIIANKSVAVWMEMGLGKTAATLTAINTLMFEDFSIRGVLIIAPKRVASHVWASEIKKWGHLSHLKISVIKGTEKERRRAMATKADIYTLGRDNTEWYFNQMHTPRTDMLVVDEATSFKNHDAKRFKALKKQSFKFRKRVLLTGSPAPNGYMGLWSQFFILDGGSRLGKTITNYRDSFFHPAFSNGHIVYKYDLNKGAREEIHSAIGDITMSMKAADYLDMPDKVINEIPIALDDEVYSKYVEFENELLLELDEVDITALNAAGLSNKLQQFSNGAVYDEDHAYHVVHDAKLEALEEIIETEKSVLIAWSFKHDRDRIMERFKKYKPVNLKTDKDIDDWNAGKIRILLMHPASGGHGLNLQSGGNIIVWFGPTWDLELYQQLNARLHRQGQTEAVIIHHLICSGTIDQEIMKALSSKGAGQEVLMAAIKRRREQASLRA